MSEDFHKNVWLFNIEEDPEERSDLSFRFPTVAKRLLQRLHEHNMTAVPCNYPDFDPSSDPKLHGGFWGPWL